MAVKITFTIGDKCNTHTGISRVYGGTVTATPKYLISKVANGSSSANTNTLAISQNNSVASTNVEVTVDCGEETGNQSITLEYTNGLGNTASATKEVNCGSQGCTGGSTLDCKRGTPLTLTWNADEYGSEKAKSSTGWKGLITFTQSGCSNINGIQIKSQGDNNFSFYIDGLNPNTNGNIGGELGNSLAGDHVIYVYPTGKNTSMTNALTASLSILTYDYSYEIGKIELTQSKSDSVSYTLNITSPSDKKLVWTGSDTSAKRVNLESYKTINGTKYYVDPEVVISGDDASHFNVGNAISTGNRDIPFEYYFTVEPKSTGSTTKIYTAMIMACQNGQSDTVSLQHEKLSTSSVYVNVTLMSPSGLKGRMEWLNSPNSSSSTPNPTYTFPDSDGSAVTVNNKITKKARLKFTVTQTSNSGYTFSGWTIIKNGITTTEQTGNSFELSDPDTNANTLIVRLNADESVTYTIYISFSTVLSYSGCGTVKLTYGSNSVSVSVPGEVKSLEVPEYGEYTLSVTTTDGYQFECFGKSTGFTINTDPRSCSGDSKDVKIKATQDCRYWAQFTKPTYKLTVKSNSTLQGIVSCDGVNGNRDVTYNVDDKDTQFGSYMCYSFSIKATPQPGYEFDRWTFTGTSQTGIPSTSSFGLLFRTSGNYTVTAYFKKINYTYYLSMSSTDITFSSKTNNPGPTYEITIVESSRTPSGGSKEKNKPTVSISNTSNFSYEIVDQSVAYSYTLKITPKSHSTTGTYTAVITVTNGDQSISINATDTVTAPQPETYTISVQKNTGVSYITIAQNGGTPSTVEFGSATTVTRGPYVSGTVIDWTAGASSGYTMTKSKGSLVVEAPNLYISPTATQNSSGGSSTSDEVLITLNWEIYCPNDTWANRLTSESFYIWFDDPTGTISLQSNGSFSATGTPQAPYYQIFYYRLKYKQSQFRSKYKSGDIIKINTSIRSNGYCMVSDSKYYGLVDADGVVSSNTGFGSLTGAWTLNAQLLQTTSKSELLFTIKQQYYRT